MKCDLVFCKELLKLLDIEDKGDDSMYGRIQQVINYLMRYNEADVRYLRLLLVDKLTYGTISKSFNRSIYTLRDRIEDLQGTLRDEIILEYITNGTDDFIKFMGQNLKEIKSIPGISKRIKNALRRAGFETVDDLKTHINKYGSLWVKRISNFGETMANDLIEVSDVLNLGIRETIEAAGEEGTCDNVFKIPDRYFEGLQRRGVDSISNFSEYVNRQGVVNWKEIGCKLPVEYRNRIYDVFEANGGYINRLRQEYRDNKF